MAKRQKGSKRQSVNSVPINKVGALRKTIPHSRPTLGDEEKKSVCDVISSGLIAEGEEVENFQRKFASYVGRKYGIAVNSGTTAIYVALRGLGITRGDKVMVPAYTCVALCHAIKVLGAEPCLIDAESDGVNLSIKEIRKQLSNEVKAIIVVHNFGMPVAIDEIVDLGIPVIENITHSIGGFMSGRKMGSVGQIAICSLYATKMMTTGEGGIILTDDKNIAERICDFKSYDLLKNDLGGKLNIGMTDVQAAIGLCQLEKLNHFVLTRKAIAKKYMITFGRSEKVENFSRNFDEDTFYRYVFKVKNQAARDTFISSCQKSGVICDIPIERPPFLAKNVNEHFHNSSAMLKRIVSVPIYPSLSDQEIKKVLDVCSAGLRKL